MAEVSLARCSSIEAEMAGAAVRFDFDLPSGGQVETAGLYLPHRKPKFVVCAPSQLGCVFRCRMCGLKDSTSAIDLSPVQIMDLVLQTCNLASNTLGLCNSSDPWQVSFMGQGEPLANSGSIIEAMDRLADAYPTPSFGISTIGMPKRLRQLAQSPARILERTRLQLSLHASMDTIRHILLPGTRGWSITEMLDAAAEVWETNRHPISLNYVLISGVNDDEASLRALAKIADPRRFT